MRPTNKEKVMHITDAQKQALSGWMMHALSCEQMTRDGYDSIDMEELFEPDEKMVDTDQILLSIASYAALIELYKPYAQDLMISLRLTLPYSESLQKHTFEDLMEGRLKLRQPPELFLTKRSLHGEFYALESYRKSFTQTHVSPSYGVVWSYYESLADGTDDMYVHDFNFKHYPFDDLEDIGRA
jgi:hypothetical protein